MTSQALQNAQSIEQVAALINNGGTSDYNANKLAGEYAASAALDLDVDSVNKDEIIAHLDILKTAGAEFNTDTAAFEGLISAMLNAAMIALDHAERVELYNYIDQHPDLDTDDFRANRTHVWAA